MPASMATPAITVTVVPESLRSIPTA
jgi:hypothetical protein